MKQYRNKCFLALGLVFLLISCDVGDDWSPTSGGKVTGIDAQPADEAAIVSWSTSGNMSYTSVYLSVEPSVQGYPKKVKSGSGASLVTGLTNDVTYTFTITSEYSGSSTGSYSASATPNSSVAIQIEEYSAHSNDVIEVKSNIVRISGVSGKTILYANINPSSSVIESASMRHLAGAISSNLSGSSNLMQTQVSTSRSVQESLAQAEDDGVRITHYVQPKTISVQAKSRNARATSSPDTFNKADPAIGQTLTLWKDVNSSMNQYQKAQMKLRAIGKNSDSSIACLVWVADENYSETRYGGKIVNKAICEAIAKTFADHHAEEEKIFGSPADNLITYDAANSIDDFTQIKNSSSYLTPMESSNATGEYVNIVLYDIGNDYTGSRSGGVVGYFSMKDYFKKDNRYPSNSISYVSNAGKFFYVDAPFCNYVSGLPFNGNGKVSNTVISTLFHEFQHMIAFGNKDLEGIDTNCNKSFLEGHAFNEMMSMLAEDIMAENLELQNTNDYVAKNRLPHFNNYYWASGLMEYLNNENSVLSYSTAYALGAYAVRNHGGVKTIHTMATNKTYGTACLFEATGISFDKLLEEFVQACAFRTDYAKANTKPTFNVNSGAYEGFSLKAINLFSKDYAWSVKNATYYGPALLSQNEDYPLRPTGFHLYSVGTANSDTVTLYFSPGSNDKVIVYIQDSFSTTQADTTTLAN